MLEVDAKKGTVDDSAFFVLRISSDGSIARAWGRQVQEASPQATWQHASLSCPGTFLPPDAVRQAIPGHPIRRGVMPRVVGSG